MAGCGRYAGGQGYNSIGHFCGGWAGNCGDGGIGGSTWYLVCDRCREKYLREKQTAAREKVLFLNLPPWISFWHHTDFHEINSIVFLCFPGEAVEEETSTGEDSKGAAHYGGPPGDSGQRIVPTVPQQCSWTEHAVPPSSSASSFPPPPQPEGGCLRRTPQ